MSLLIAPSIPEKMSAYTLLQHSSPLSLLPVSQVDRPGSRHRGPQQGVCVCVCMCGGHWWTSITLLQPPSPTAPCIFPVTLQLKQKQLPALRAVRCRQKVSQRQRVRHPLLSMFFFYSKEEDVRARLLISRGCWERECKLSFWKHSSKMFKRFIAFYYLNKDEKQHTSHTLWAIEPLICLILAAVAHHSYFVRYLRDYQLIISKRFFSCGASLKVKTLCKCLKSSWGLMGSRFSGCQKKFRCVI